MDVKLPHGDNPAITAVLKSATLHRIVEERANTAAMLYQSQVAKRTGRLAASAHASTEIGGRRNDRWIGVLTIGGPGPRGTVDYAVPHEFGYYVENSDGATVGYRHAAHDLNRVLALIEYVA